MASSSAAKTEGDREVFVELLHRRASKMPSLSGALSQSGKEQVKDVLRLLLAVCPALLAVVILCVFGMVQVSEQKAETNRLKSHVVQAQSTRNVLEKLAKERGTTCAYISTRSALFQEQLFAVRDDMDLALLIWTEEGELIKEQVNRGREMVDKQIFGTCQDSIDFYTNMTISLITSIYEKFYKADDGGFWNLAVHFNNILYANDLIGLKRAMGSSFLTQFIHSANMTKYHEISGSSNLLLEQARQYVPSANQVYIEELEEQATLQSRLSQLELLMTQTTRENQTALSAEWFALMTSYINVIGKMEQEISNQLEEQLEIKLKHTRFVFWIQILILTSISLVCPCLIVAYTLHMNRLVKKCRMYSAEVQAKGRQIQQQHQRTELFLNRILPELQRLCVNCHCQNSNRAFVTELQQDIIRQVWELQQD